MQKKKALSLVDQEQYSPPNTSDIIDKFIRKELTNIEVAKRIGIQEGRSFD